MFRTTTSKARLNFQKVLKAASRGDRIILYRHGKPIAAIVPVEDARYMEDVEDRYFAKKADEALAEIEQGGETISLEDLKNEFGL